VKVKVLKRYGIWRKEEHLEEKVTGGMLPLDEVKWISASLADRVYLASLEELTESLSKRVRVFRGFPIEVSKGMIRTNRGEVFKADPIINAGSREKLNRLIGIREDLNSIIVAVTLIVAHRSGEHWDFYVDGGDGTLFSYILRFQHLVEGLDVYYAFSFFHELREFPPDYLIRLRGDLKRRRLIEQDRVVGLRTRIFREGLLVGTPKEEVDWVISVGRLGKWSNLSVCECIKEAESLRIT
jgi:hypothetical protein